MKTLNLGEAKNNKKLLELGKEITQEVIERFEDSFYQYVKVKDIKDETLISIGKKLYSNPDAFMDYLRNVYEEDNFEWDESAINSYDLIHDIVSCEIVDSGEYYFDYDSEMYFLITDVSEIEKVERLTYKLNEIKKDSPLTIMLNKKEDDFMLVRISEDEKYYILENRIDSLNNESIETKYLCTEDEDYVSLVDNITRLLSEYNNLNGYKKWSDIDTANHFWEYIKDAEEFENIETYLSKENNPVFYTKLMDGLMANLKDKEANNLNEIKKELYLYHNGQIDVVEDSYLELKELIWKTVHDNFKDEFVSDENYIWKPINVVDKFKSDLRDELNKLLDINTFDLPGVLPKDIEYTILQDYIKDVVVDLIKNEKNHSIAYDNLEYMWEKAEEYVDVFLNKGNLKNLTEDELNSIHLSALDYREEETVRNISIRYLKEYLVYILIVKNDDKNKFDLIALYRLMLEDMDKIEPHIENMLKNNFTFKELNHRVENLQCKDTYIKKEVSEEFKTIFNFYICKK